MRHTLLRLSLTFSFALTLAACTGSATPPTSTPPTQITEAPTQVPATKASATESAGLPPAPECKSPATPTIPMTEGPFFKPNSPERTSLLEPGLPGIKLSLSGYVLTTDCQPVAQALLDFWQADSEGQYDNTGYRLRGHQFTDATGHYQLETIMPGLYPGRTEHIHVKVQAPNGPVLTTQVFFPGITQNQTDSIFDPSLVVTLQDAEGGKVARFNFVVE